MEWYRECASWNVDFHHTCMTSWRPYPFFFGPLGDRTLFEWHTNATHQYSKAVREMEECIEKGHECDTVGIKARYDRFDWAIVRDMQLAFYTHRPVYKEK